MQIQVNCTTNIACEWMLDYGGCEQLEKFLASAVFDVCFFEWLEKNVFLLQLQDGMTWIMWVESC